MNLFQFLIVATIAVAGVIQFQLKQTGVKPVKSPLPALPDFPTSIKNITGLVELVGGGGELVGPESLIAAGKYLFATLGDGRIARISHDANSNGKPSWEYLLRTKPGPSGGRCGFSPSDEAETEFACGRPLGLKVVKRSTVDPKFYATGEDDDEDVLVVADGYQGLIMITNIFGAVGQAKATTLAFRANSDPKNYEFRLLNALVQAPDGSLYITETTQQFQRRRIFYAAFDGRKAGRLLRYTKEEGCQVVANGLYMPNGIALSHDQQKLLIVSGVQVLQYSLETKQISDFIPVLPGTGDNIDAMDHLPSGGNEARKCYWAGLGSKYSKPFSLLKFASKKVWFKSILVALVPYGLLVDFIPKLSALAVYDEAGEIIEVYRDDSVVFPWMSEGETFDGYLYLGSWYNPSLARIKQSDL